jgi:hypothetical protein
MKFREKIARFMDGRNGTDDLGRFLLIVSLVLVVLSMLIRGLAGSILWALVLVVLIICYFRILSRNVYKRRSENEWYLRRKNAVSRWFRSLKDRWNQRKEYRFFRCPSCHTLLRVPKRKGKILLTCRKCGRRFERKT